MKKLNETETRHATAFASNLAECERRNDYGGLHRQAARDLLETILTNTAPWGRGYITPSGRATKKFRDAAEKWIAVSAK